MISERYSRPYFPNISPISVRPNEWNKRDNGSENNFRNGSLPSRIKSIKSSINNPVFRSAFWLSTKSLMPFCRPSSAIFKSSGVSTGNSRSILSIDEMLLVVVEIDSIGYKGNFKLIDQISIKEVSDKEVKWKKIVFHMEIIINHKFDLMFFNLS